MGIELAEGFATHSTVNDFGNHKSICTESKAAFWGDVVPSANIYHNKIHIKASTGVERCLGCTRLG